MQLFIKIGNQLWQLFLRTAEAFSAFLDKKLSEKKT